MGGTPKWMVSNQKPIEIDDMGEALFQETIIYWLLQVSVSVCKLSSMLGW